ncbi:MAG: hypothetical protein IJX74_06245 [Clostridia bacterium]|nr:hypothetical protein [Clostridia bacterium]
MLGDTNTYAYEGGYARFYIVPEEGTYYIQNVGSGNNSLIGLNIQYQSSGK